MLLYRAIPLPTVEEIEEGDQEAKDVKMTD
jgi:hypothetical protein